MEHRSDPSEDHVLVLDALASGEPLIVFSVSGVNNVVVEVAAESRSRGLRAIAITSRSYRRAVAEARGLARTLISEADLVIDNHVPIGDAVVPIPHSDFRAASISSIAASLVYHLLLEQIVKHLTERGVRAPIFASSNLPNARAHKCRIDRSLSEPGSELLAFEMNPLMSENQPLLPESLIVIDP